ncbi:metallophosphoesterase [Photobacterium sp. 1_MG-2023]|uniref:metallophosphoesterase n=1 Tax=Photobacterium sp. 1_MG-2023 TaxID=3062646 RepID=UPI0026E2E7E3|nr:metallophosphoesterase [Photobacterium sp. 1_MG-2023]MDO6706521.1 metallophosphoesterase [Photobacterium sp. 1_MG-2023]
MHEYLQLDIQYDIYFLSDPHGQYQLMLDVLEKIGFRYPHNGQVRDRLFILGDLIDRGPDSMAILAFVQNNPAVYAIQGNHEHMACRAFRNPDHQALWLMNGGRWHEHCDPEALQASLRFAQALPVCYTLQINGHQIGLIHAAVPSPFDWQYFTHCCDEGLLSDEALTDAIWDREAFLHDPEMAIAHIDAVVMGHNIVTGLKPKVCGNRIYIDGAMSMGDRGMILKYRRGGEVLGLFQEYAFLREKDSDQLVWI